MFILVAITCWETEGDVSLGFGAGVAGLGFVLPRGPGSGESAVAHKGSPPLLSDVELGEWSRVRGLRVDAAKTQTGVLAKGEGLCQ